MRKAIEKEQRVEHLNCGELFEVHPSMKSKRIIELNFKSFKNEKLI